MNLVTNSVDPERVVEQTIAGDRHLLARDVTILKPMDLSGGYVPAEEVRKSVDKWAVPETVDHPWNLPDKPWYQPGTPLMQPLSANADGVAEHATVGETRNPRLVGDEVVVDLDVNADRARELGGEAEQIVRALENGDPLEVSSQYFAADLPPGEYDGAYRDDVEGQLVPDSVALLANREGVCSLADGCGFNPDPGAMPQGATATANAGGSVTLRVAATNDPVSPEGGLGEDGGQQTTMHNTANASVAVHTPEFSGTSTGDWSAPTLGDFGDNPDLGDVASHYVVSMTGFPPDTFGDLKLPVVAPDGTLNLTALQNAAARVSQVDGLSGDALARAVSVIESLANDNFESADFGASANSSARSLIQTGLALLGLGGADASTVDEPAESGAESAADAATDSMKNEDRKRLIEEITANSEIKAKSLEGMGDTCLQTTHEHIVANSDGPEEEQTETNESDTDEETETVTDDEPNTVEIDLGEHDSIDEYIAARVSEAVTANAAEREKAGRVDHIVANSNEYGEDDREWLMDTPEKALDRIESGLDTGGSALPGRAGGLSANAAGNGAGSDADLDDVSAGVFD